MAQAPPAALRIWVTRTQPGADATAARLARLGHRPLVAPVLETHPLPDASPSLAGATAMAFTSAAAVRALVALEDGADAAGRNLPAFCVGRVTAAAARAAGFTETISADGDVAALATLIAARAVAGSTVLHLCAIETAGDLAGPLAGSGVVLQRRPIYETRAVGALPPAVTDALGADALDAMLIHSPKAAGIVAGLLAPLPPATLGRLQAFAISPAALAPLRRLPLAVVTIAPAPNETALLGLLP